MWSKINTVCENSVQFGLHMCKWLWKCMHIYRSTQIYEEF